MFLKNYIIVFKNACIGLWIKWDVLTENKRNEMFNWKERQETKECNEIINEKKKAMEWWIF